MSDIDLENNEMPSQKPKRDVWSALKSGMKSKCPRCHKGNVFYKYLKIKDECGHCGQQFHHHRADDFPPYIAITIVGHVVLSLAVSVQIAYEPSMLVHLALWIPLTFIMCLSLLPPIKGALVGLQWSLRLHDFDNNDTSPKWNGDKPREYEDQF